MMKKKILIINKSFALGGIQMALANMLEAIHNEYDVTLAIFNPNGPFARVPNNVRMLTLSPFVQVLGMSRIDCKKYGTIRQNVFKLIGSVWSKIFSNTLPVKFALAFQRDVGEYDVVISYHHETGAKTLVTGFGEFALRKCKSPQKIIWVHADLLATGQATKRNMKVYQCFDKIVCVSQFCMDNFISAYPFLKDKCDYCYNCVLEGEIIEKSSVKQNVFERNKNTTVLFSASRLAEEKGLVPALEALLPLWRDDFDLKWYIAGEGKERERIEDIIKENHLENIVVLLGFQSNPYPYIKEADYLFLPSLHEAFSMVVKEAHILGTSVIASDIPIMREVLTEKDILWNPKKDGLKELVDILVPQIQNKYIVSERPDNFMDCFSRVIGGDDDKRYR